MNKLSVVIIAFNEEENIGRCIDSVRDIADEIIVVDSFSTDMTQRIAVEKGARVKTHPFEGHIEQKNWAKDQSTYDYVLSLDADERLSDELMKSIQKAKQNFAYDGYTMNRLNYYCGKAIKTCGWYPDKKLRVWNKTKGQWKGLNPHDKFELQPNTRQMHLEGDILHDTFPTPDAFLKQVDKFATISATQLKVRNVFYLTVKMIFSPPFKFLRIYFLKQGFREGQAGMTICYNQSREVFLKYWRAIKFKYGSVA